MYAHLLLFLILYFTFILIPMYIPCVISVFLFSLLLPWHVNLSTLLIKGQSYLMYLNKILKVQAGRKSRLCVFISSNSNNPTNNGFTTFVFSLVQKKTLLLLVGQSHHHLSPVHNHQSPKSPSNQNHLQNVSIKNYFNQIKWYNK